MTTSEEFLEHYGVKGMKWGVRKDRGHEGERAKTKKIEKLDKKFERNASSIKTMIAVNNKAAEMTNKNDVDRINNKPEYKEKDFSRDSPLRKKYYREHQKAFMDNLEKAADELGTNASGTKKYGILEGSHSQNSMDWQVVVKDVKHATINADGDVEIRVKVLLTSTGHVVSLHTLDDPLVQDALTEEELEFLEHYGVKGMKWGKRKQRPGPSKDAKRASQIYKKGKAGSPRALTNKEIEEFTRRVNLEQKYKKVTPSKRKVTSMQITAAVGSVNAAIAFANTPAGKAVGKQIKKSATKAYDKPINYKGLRMG